MTRPEWDKLVNAWLLDLTPTKSESTMHFYMQRLRWFTNWMEATNTEYALTIETVHGYFRSIISEGKAINSIVAIDRTIKVFAAWLKFHGHISFNPTVEYNPLTHIGHSNKPTKTFTPYTAEEIIKMRELLKKDRSVQARQVDLIIVAQWCTGMRYSDAIRLRWEDIDMDNRTITFVPRKGRRFGASVTVPLDPEFFQCLNWFYAGQKGNYVLPQQRWGSWWAKINSRVGKLWRGHHNLRRAFVTRLGSSGEDALTIGKFTGQKPQTVAKYFEPSLETKRAVLQKAHVSIDPK